MRFLEFMRPEESQEQIELLNSKEITMTMAVSVLCLAHISLRSSSFVDKKSKNLIKRWGEFYITKGFSFIFFILIQ